MSNIVSEEYNTEVKIVKKAIIHDWLDMYCGAERVVTAISEIYDFDYHYAYVNKMSEEDLLKTFAGKKVKVIDSKIFRPVKSFFRYFMPFFPLLLKSFNRQTMDNKVDLVISSSWVLSKGYRIGNETHICYLHSRNFKYVWDEAHLYFRGPLKLFSFLIKPLQRFDKNSANVPDYLIANSKFVQEWVRDKYNKESTVIYPPVDVSDFYISKDKEEYYVTVGRLVPYKRFELIIEAFNENGKRLKVVGDGSIRNKLEKKANSNIEFLGFKSKTVIIDILAKAKAFVFAAEEDFGIVIVEALASGLPVIAYKGGASKELINSETGVLYTQQSAESLNNAIIYFEENQPKFNSEKIRKSALRFSKDRFKKEISEFIDNVIVNKKQLSH